MASLLAALSFLIAACGGPLNQGLQPSGPQTPINLNWEAIDVGAVGLPGTTVADDSRDAIVMLGAGNDIWGTQDAFHMASVELIGDGSIVTQINQVEAVHEWTKAGVMMRASREPSAANIFLHMTPENGSVMQARRTAGDVTIEPGYASNLRPPQWLKLERTGNTFTGSYSQDGQQWTTLGSVDVEMPNSILVGLAVTSLDPNVRAEAVFEETRVTRGDASDPVTPDPTTPTRPAPNPPGGPRTSVSFNPDYTDFANPERGWYVETDSGNYRNIAGQGFRIAFKYVNLQDYRSSYTLPGSVLNQLTTDLNNARDAGIKLVVRFAYNRSDAPDAPIDVVLNHISQVGPILAQNADVVAAVQGGFVGAWGEWHSSSNNLTSLENRVRITEALLSEVPDTRMVQLRYPRFTREQYPNEPNGTARTFDGSDASRIGLINDCFLTSGSDTGTYESQEDRDHFARISKYVAVGGETCSSVGLADRNNCVTALHELALYHWDYLNSEFYRPIIDRWRTSGCYDEISRRLGYRYEMATLSSPTDLVPGMSLDMTFTIRNVGFGKLYNPRPLQIVLVPTSGGSPVVVNAIEDAREVLPLAGEERTFTLDGALPADTPIGSYFAYIRLPDGSTNLQSNPNYSIRMANASVWDSALGANDLSLWVNVVNK